MKDSRINNNPVNQNKHIYKCITVNYECGWNIPCDYYINRTSYKPDIKYFSTKKSKWKAQVGIQIIDENARKVFESMCMTDYIFRGISSYSIDHSAIHQAFNETYNKKAITLCQNSIKINAKKLDF